MNVGKIIERIAEAHVENIVQERHGCEAARVFR